MICFSLAYCAHLANTHVVLCTKSICFTKILYIVLIVHFVHFMWLFARCTAKSEASTLLAVKQAAFIKNPDYEGDGSGPDIVTIGHNPFVPNLGLASHVVLNSVTTTSTALDHRPSKISLARLLKLNALRGGGVLDKIERAVLKTTNEEWTRHRFLDMYLYNR